MLNVPYPPALAPLLGWKLSSPSSVSSTGRVQVAGGRQRPVLLDGPPVAPVVSPLITAASLSPVMLMLTVWDALPSTLSTTKLSESGSPDSERLHVRVGVVQRVGPVACRRQLNVPYPPGAPVAVPSAPGSVRVVDVGDVQVAGRGQCPASVGDAAGLNRPAGNPGDHGGVVVAV